MACAVPQDVVVDGAQNRMELDVTGHTGVEADTVASEPPINAAPTRSIEQDTKWMAVKRAWNNQISLHVPHEACRDHLANERTYLAYLRTSLALSTMGIAITQLLRLERNLVIMPRFDYFILGKPLGVLFQVSAMVVALVGAHRFWRQQVCMARGTVMVGGWEIYVIMASFLLLTVGVFALLIAADFVTVIRT